MSLLQRYIEAVSTNSGPTYANAVFTGSELWEMVGLGLYEARAEGRCDDQHHVWSQTVTGTIEPHGYCDQCWEESPVLYVNYSFWPRLYPKKSVPEPVRGFAAIQWKAEMFLQAYPPDLFPPLSDETYNAVPAEVRRAIWIRAVQDVTRRILDAGKS